jgi:hypothetical protein
MQIRGRTARRLVTNFKTMNLAVDEAWRLSQVKTGESEQVSATLSETEVLLQCFNDG